eukprot:SAG11_NODE_3039_length_2741_cov_2.441711_2_plen_223_part_00
MRSPLPYSYTYDILSCVDAAPHGAAAVVVSYDQPGSGEVVVEINAEAAAEPPEPEHHPLRPLAFESAPELAPCATAAFSFRFLGGTYAWTLSQPAAAAATAAMPLYACFRGSRLLEEYSESKRLDLQAEDCAALTLEDLQLISAHCPETEQFFLHPSTSANLRVVHYCSLCGPALPTAHVVTFALHALHLSENRLAQNVHALHRDCWSDLNSTPSNLCHCRS